MKPDLNNIDKVVECHLPSASNEEIEVDSARVLQRLRSNTARANDHAFQKTFLVLKPLTFVRWRIAAAAAVVVLGVLIGAIAWRESRTFAVAENRDGGLYRVVEGETQAIVAGEGIVRGETVRSSGGSGAALVLRDGSRVEMRSKSELWFGHAEDGIRIHLRQGSVIVNASKQGSGHLYVQTKDVMVSVVGTVFLVNAEEEGSRVAVIEGEVRVQQGAIEKNLRPGDQVTTNPKMESLPVKEEISWSRNAEAHAALLQQSAVVPTEPREAFVVVSVRPTRFSGAGERGAGGGRVSIRPAWAPCGDHPNSFFLKFDPSRADISDMTVHGLISWAYGLECRGGSAGSDFLIGGPGWTKSDGFDIQALIPAGAAAYTTSRVDIGGGRTASPQIMAPRFRKMLQALLADRFKLVVRREAKDVPSYVLSVAKGGQKLTPWKEGDPVTVNEMRSFLAQKRFEAETVVPGMALHDVVGAKAPISALLAQIEHYVQKPVVDRTGLTGEYNFYVIFERRGPAEESTPSLAAALERELGLKLEATKTSAEVLVIESVERPSEN